MNVNLQFQLCLVCGEREKKCVHESHHKHINYPPLCCSRILNFLLFSISIIDNNNNNNEMYIVYYIKMHTQKSDQYAIVIGVQFYALCRIKWWKIQQSLNNYLVIVMSYEYHQRLLIHIKRYYAIYFFFSFSLLCSYLMHNFSFR